MSKQLFLYFITNFRKSIDKIKIILYYVINLEGVMYINIVQLFFIILLFNIFITFYSIYTFINSKLFHNVQGAKLKILEKNFQKGSDQIK